MRVKVESVGVLAVDDDDPTDLRYLSKREHLSRGGHDGPVSVCSCILTPCCRLGCIEAEASPIQGCGESLDYALRLHVRQKMANSGSHAHLYSCAARTIPVGKESFPHLVIYPYRLGRAKEKEEGK